MYASPSCAVYTLYNHKYAHVVYLYASMTRVEYTLYTRSAYVSFNEPCSIASITKSLEPITARPHMTPRECASTYIRSAYYICVLLPALSPLLREVLKWVTCFSAHSWREGLYQECLGKRPLPDGEVSHWDFFPNEKLPHEEECVTPEAFLIWSLPPTVRAKTRHSFMYLKETVLKQAHSMYVRAPCTYATYVSECIRST